MTMFVCSPLIASSCHGNHHVRGCFYCAAHISILCVRVFLLSTHSNDCLYNFSSSSGTNMSIFMCHCFLCMNLIKILVVRFWNELSSLEVKSCLNCRKWGNKMLKDLWLSKVNKNEMSPPLCIYCSLLLVLVWAATENSLAKQKWCSRCTLTESQLVTDIGTPVCEFCSWCACCRFYNSYMLDLG